MVEHTDLDEVWMVVSPQNPFKSKDSLAPDRERHHMLTLAIGDNYKLRASDIEFGMPRPSYTIDTLAVLKEKYPHFDFTLLMGGDNLATLHKWKNHDVILKYYRIFVYSRPNYDLGPLQDHENVTIIEAPMLDISASFIRQTIQDHKSIQYLVPDAVYAYIAGSSLYK